MHTQYILYVGIVENRGRGKRRGKMERSKMEKQVKRNKKAQWMAGCTHQ